MAEESNESLELTTATNAAPEAQLPSAEAEAPAPKRRGRPRKAAAPEPAAAPADAQDGALAEAAAPAEAPAPKRRGRPRKTAAPEPEAPVAGVQESLALDDAPAEAPAPKRRGRPRKAAAAEALAADAQDGTPAEALAPEGADAAAPKRTRRTRKRAAADEAQEHDAQAPVDTPQLEGALPAPSATMSEAQAAQPLEAPSSEAKPEERRRNRQQRDADANQGNGNNNQGNNNRNRRKNNRNRRGFLTEPTLSREELQGMKVAELRAKAAEFGIDGTGVRKPELVEVVYAAAAKAEGFGNVSGVLDIGHDGFAVVRTGNFCQGDHDAMVPQQLVKSLGLRPGDLIAGQVRPGRPQDRYSQVSFVESVNGHAPGELTRRPRFRDLTPVFPNERLVMEMGKDSITGRAIDLVSPIGKGQRGLIVSPPKAGKTTVLKRICQSIAHNNPEVHLFCLLVDERPEEVTDMERSIKGTVVASTFDQPASNHTAVSELVIEHAKRLVEMGEDVVVVLDSITRLARAYNLAAPASGRILSGGVDSAALYPPKKFLGAARNIEGGGSLTILASALVETGSKMDEVIFEEFKGTGNMELKLDRGLADRRIFPAIDCVASGTRNEDLLVDAELQPFVWGIRRILANMNNCERSTSALIKGLKATDNNQEFLIRSAKKAQQAEFSDAL